MAVTACPDCPATDQTATTSRPNIMFGIKLRPEAVKLREDVERFFGTPILEERRSDPKSRYYAGAGFAPSGAPQITLFREVTDEASVVHELLHLKLIAEGFPFLKFTLPIEFINVPTTRFLQIVQSHIDDTLQHRLFFPEMRRMGYD